MRHTVEISKHALASIRATIATSDPHFETGGALFGHEHRLLITTASGPGPTAVHQPSYFLRDLEHTQRAANDAYNMDGSQWLGEWHTHPTGPPEPSPLDLNTYISHLTDPELRFERFIALIGTPKPLPYLSAWVLVRSSAGTEIHRATLAVALVEHRALMGDRPGESAG